MKTWLWPGKQMITLREFELAACVTRRVIYGMIDRGELQVTKLGREYRIPRAEAFRVLLLPDPEPSAERPPLSVVPEPPPSELPPLDRRDRTALKKAVLALRRHRG